MTFYEWLSNQVDRDDAIGDIARDVMADSTAPIGAKSYKRWRRHLVRMDACDDALEALKETWDEYIKVVDI